MPGRSTTEHIFGIRQLIEKATEFPRNRPYVYIAFVDFKEAFDSLDRPSIWLCLQAAGIPLKLCNLFMMLYDESES
jgi:hypothetical protein